MKQHSGKKTQAQDGDKTRKLKMKPYKRDKKNRQGEY